MNAEYLATEGIMTFVWVIIALGTAVTGGLLAAYLTGRYQGYKSRRANND